VRFAYASAAMQEYAADKSLAQLKNSLRQINQRSFRLITEVLIKLT